MNANEKRKLGRTDVELTQFGFGAASLGEIFALVSEEDTLSTLQTLWKHGVRYIDTAPFYGFGLSEHRVGSFLSQQPRQEFVLSTKVGRVLKAPKVKAGFKAPFFLGGLPFDYVFDYTYDGIMRSFEDSLQRLRLNSIDLLLIHDLEFGHHGAKLQTYRDQFSDSGWRAVERLRSTGEVRAIGAGANELEVIPYFLERFDLDFFILARQYTLLEQDALDEALPMCQARNVGIILASVFNSGILVTGPVEGAKYVYEDAPAEVLEKVTRIEQVCRRHN
ncbi:pyridoxal 4-dehydrogenase, partial [Candidatus Poribacteria bacterium]|nr:pyridoxal 4-dehydrogenase [Candidatus Poribacteria bacterium]